MIINTLLPLFDIRCTLYIGKESLDKYALSYLKLTGKPLDSFEDCVSGHCGGSIIWAERDDPYIVAHEISHMADEISNFLGITDSSGEFRAYVIGWLSRSFDKKLHPPKKKKK